MTKYIAILLALPLVATAKSYSTPEKAIVLGGNDIGKRVCYYEDKAYSEGAVLRIGEQYIVCGKANSFETNGQLKWVQLENKPKK